MTAMLTSVAVLSSVGAAVAVQAGSTAEGDVTIPLWLVVTAITAVFGILTAAIGTLWRAYTASEARNQANIRLMVDSDQAMATAFRDMTEAINHERAR